MNEVECFIRVSKHKKLVMKAQGRRASTAFVIFDFLVKKPYTMQADEAQTSQAQNLTENLAQNLMKARSRRASTAFVVFDFPVKKPYTMQADEAQASQAQNMTLHAWCMEHFVFKQ